MYQLPDHDYLFSLCNDVSELLEKEITEYRPAASNGEAGSLLVLSQKLPAVIIPDIHARPEFIKNILRYKLKKNFCGASHQTVKSAMEKGLINVVCLGDAVHNETNKERWIKINEEFLLHDYTGAAMQEEMGETLEALCNVMELKLKYPEHFHFLKGNHENILNETGGGDFSFRKYAQEGEMVKLFIQSFYGDDILYLISCYEKALPLIACGKNYVVSHAEPMCAFTKKQLINARENPSVVQGLIWTANDQVEERTVMPILKALCKINEDNLPFYFGGHRPVKENFALRQEGLFIQIHNPKKQNICLVHNDRIFNPLNDIVSVCKEK